MSNSAIRVVGRLDAAEAGRPEYGFLPPSQRTRATLAKPGTMFVSQPEIPVPLAVEFPFPAWATRLARMRRAAARRRPARRPTVGVQPAAAARRRRTRRSDRTSPAAVDPPRGRPTTVKFLHTSDWHVGKTLKGRDRLDEQTRGARREIVADRPRSTRSTRC